MLCVPCFSEFEQSTVELQEDDPEFLEICFRVFHDRITPETYSGFPSDIKLLIYTCDKHGFDVKRLKDWFAEWYKGLQGYRLYITDPPPRHMRFLIELFFPCWVFDHMPGFQDASKEVFYDGWDGIGSPNPDDLPPKLHMPERIIRRYIAVTPMKLMMAHTSPHTN